MRFYLVLLLLTTKLMSLTDSCDEYCEKSEVLDISANCVNNSFGTVAWTLNYEDYDPDDVSIRMECFENKTLVIEHPVEDSDSLEPESRSVSYSTPISSGTSCSFIGCVATQGTTCRVTANTVCTYTPTSNVGSDITVTSNEIIDYFTMTTSLDHSSTALVSMTGVLHYSLFSSIKETTEQQMTTLNTLHPSSTGSVITQSSQSQSFQSLDSQFSQSLDPTLSNPDSSIDIAVLTIIIGSVLIGVIGTIVCCIIVFVYIIVWRNSKRVTHNEPQDFSLIFETELYKLDDISLGSVVTIFQPLQNCTPLSEKANTTNNKDTESNQSNNVKELFSSMKTDNTLKALESNKLTEISNNESPQESNKLSKIADSNTHNSSSTPVRTAAMTSSSACDTSGYVTVAHMLNTQPHNKESEFIDTSSDSLEYNNNEFIETRNQTSSGMKSDSSAVSDYVHM